MAETATPFKPDVQMRSQPGVVSIVGRIDDVRKVDWNDAKFYDHRVFLPAHDEFSAPAVVSIRSASKLGAKGDEIDGRARLAGSRRFSKGVDRETGEEKRMVFVQMHLVWIE